MNAEAEKKYRAGRELDEALRDEAENFLDPVMRQYVVVPDTRIPWYAGMALRFHIELEKGMKAMPHRQPKRDANKATCPLCGCGKGKANRHYLCAVYARLSPETMELLDKAFRDAVSFYDFKPDVKEWAHMESFRRYLCETGSGEHYTYYKEHWHGHKSIERLPELRINHEMVRFMSDELYRYYRNEDAGRLPLEGGRPIFVRELVNKAIFKAYNQKLQTAFVNSGDDAKFLIGYINEVIQDAFQQNPEFPSYAGNGFLRVIEDAYEHNFDVLNGRCNNFLRDLYHALKERTPGDYRVRPALDYALSTFGAKTSDCETNTCGYHTGHQESVKMPSGWNLGGVGKRHDGLWYGWLIDGGDKILANSRDKARELVIEGATKMVSMSLNGRMSKNVRVYFPNGEFAIFGIEGNISADCWNTEGIAEGDEIRLTIDEEDARGYRLSNQGIVQSIQNYMVTIVIKERIP